MKQLRILTGTHAGVHLELNSTRYVIGADDMADIQLLDWRSSPVVIEVVDNDVVSIAHSPGDLQALMADDAERFDDFKPRRVGDIVLCVGPSQGPWPSDLDLIARLTEPSARMAANEPAAEEGAAPARPPASHRVTRLLAALLGTVMMTAAAGTVLARFVQNTPTPEPVAPPPLRVRVERTIADLSLQGLHVTQEDGGQVAVRGLVGGATEVATLRARLEALQSPDIVHAYGAASDVARDIAQGLGMPGISVQWRGDGVFVVAGHAEDLGRLREAVGRIRTDLGGLVRQIDVAATEQPRGSTAPISAAFSAGALRYVQTRDGVKHLSLSDAPPPRQGAAIADEPAISNAQDHRQPETQP